MPTTSAAVIWRPAISVRRQTSLIKVPSHHRCAEGFDCRLAGEGFKVSLRRATGSRTKLELRCQLIERGRKNRMPIESKDVMPLGRRLGLRRRCGFSVITNAEPH
jgi:hypothetical protein